MKRNNFQKLFSKVESTGDLIFEIKFRNSCLLGTSFQKKNVDEKYFANFGFGKELVTESILVKEILKSFTQR